MGLLICLLLLKLGTALEKSAQGYEGVDAAIEEAFNSTKNLSTDSAAQLRAQASAVGEEIAATENLITALEGLKNVDSQYQPVVDELIARLNSSVSL